ncbi:hypothetical protein STFR1_90064 [Bacillus vallismortis]
MWLKMKVIIGLPPIFERYGNSLKPNAGREGLDSPEENGKELVCCSHVLWLRE